MTCFNESAECECCGRMDDLKERNGLMVCYDCREEIDRQAWIAAHEECHLAACEHRHPDAARSERKAA